MKKILVLAAIVACSQYSCSNSTETETSGTESTVPTEGAATENTAPATETPSQETITVDPGGMTVTPITAPSVVNAPKPAATAAGMNPPHGEPGHRCDIAVGAPLSSAPAAAPASQPAQISTQPTSSPVITTSPTITSSPAAPKTVTAPGMNPPHGEPGHDCGIAVGAPLKK